MKIPTNSDWGEVNRNDLDADCAYRQFFGKSFDEAVAMFQKNALYYQEDLQSMPAAAFNFYAPAFVKYLTSALAAGDSDGASSFMHLVSWMLKEKRRLISKETERLLLSTAEFISKNQAFYEASIGIYGLFQDLYMEIQNHAKRAD